jgi:hypothetical protein
VSSIKSIKYSCSHVGCWQAQQLVWVVPSKPCPEVGADEGSVMSSSWKIGDRVFWLSTVGHSSMSVIMG